MRTIYFTILLTIASLPLTALAQPATSNTPTITPEQRQEAMRRLQRGMRFFQERHYSDAASEFQWAFDRTGMPGILHNLGMAYERAVELPSNWRLATDAFIQFQRAGAPGLDAETLRRHIQSLCQRLEVTEREATTRREACGLPPVTNVVVTPPNPPDNVVIAPPINHVTTHVTPPPPIFRTRVEYRRSFVSRIGPWALMTAGLASGTASVLLALQANAASEQLDRASRGEVPWGTEASDMQSLHDRDQVLAWTCGIAGAALIGSGVVWLATRGPGERHEVRELQPSRISLGGQALSGGALLTLQGSL